MNWHRPRKRAPRVISKVKIIVVEDESDILEVIEYNRSREGYKVNGYRDG